jgi:SAM-dependent methyltransferase
MPASNTTAFDALAADYDITFSQSLTGQGQRTQARKCLSEFLHGKENLHILEINCGTGDDALWLASMGHRVIATDASAAMIQKAKAKSAFSDKGDTVHFFQYSFSGLSPLSGYEQFDLIFSNFSGINCIPADEIALLNQQFHQLLKPGGHVALVIFGKYSCWETFYHLLKIKPRSAFRRWSKKPSTAQLKKGINQPVYYYSISRLRRLLSGFQLSKKKPVGLFIPPSYLEGVMKKNIGFFRLLEKLEKKSGNISAFSQCADHCYLLLKKENI